MDYPIKTLSQLRPILQGFRKANGLTQAALAERLGITQQSYAKLEANPTSASVERLFTVLRALGVELVLSGATSTFPTQHDAGAAGQVSPAANTPATSATTPTGKEAKPAGRATATGDMPTPTTPQPVVATKKKERW
ncbi:helix-turn-helix domain-containing protein [Pseudogulbenkiania sp. MAI-1]|uniref:helix-turn-helix domain-containing protein n=1 Tax=Pseudogulbenkiania sp. MAI-1 TaxID=990370 RepID=UPI00045EB0D1|nr:helix-turn-helix transcriptional regulator [Pseudogulbenkiania sp. MAI-1]